MQIKIAYIPSITIEGEIKFTPRLLVMEGGLITMSGDYEDYSIPAPTTRWMDITESTDSEAFNLEGDYAGLFLRDGDFALTTEEWLEDWGLALEGLTPSNQYSAKMLSIINRSITSVIKHEARVEAQKACDLAEITANRQEIISLLAEELKEYKLVKVEWIAQNRIKQFSFDWAGYEYTYRRPDGSTIVTSSKRVQSWKRFSQKWLKEKREAPAKAALAAKKEAAQAKANAAWAEKVEAEKAALVKSKAAIAAYLESNSISSEIELLHQVGGVKVSARGQKSVTTEIDNLSSSITEMQKAILATKLEAERAKAFAQSKQQVYKEACEKAGYKVVWDEYHLVYTVSQRIQMPTGKKRVWTENPDCEWVCKAFKLIKDKPKLILKKKK